MIDILDYIWCNIEKISSTILLLIGIYTWYLTHHSTSIKLRNVSISISQLSGYSISVLLENKTLRSMCLKNIKLLFRCEDKCCCINIKEYAVPYILKPWECFEVKSNNFTLWCGDIFINGGIFSIIDDCLVVVEDVKDNLIWLSNNSIRKKFWYLVFCLRVDKNIEFPILITKKIFGHTISKNCLYSVTCDCWHDEGKNRNWIVTNDGSVYDNDTKIYRIDLTGVEAENFRNIKKFISEKTGICDCCVNVEKIEKGCSGYTVSVFQTHFSVW